MPNVPSSHHIPAPGYCAWTPLLPSWIYDSKFWNYRPFLLATSWPCSGCLMRIYLQTTCQDCFHRRVKLSFFSSLSLCPVLDGQCHCVLLDSTLPAGRGFSPVLHRTFTEVLVFFQPPHLTSLVLMIQPGVPSHLSCIFRKWPPKIFIPYFSQEKCLINSVAEKGPSFSLILLPAPSLPIPSLLLKYLMKYFAFLYYKSKYTNYKIFREKIKLDK